MNRYRWGDIVFQKGMGTTGVVSNESDLVFLENLQSSVQGYGLGCTVKCHKLGRIDMGLDQRCISINLRREKDPVSLYRDLRH